MGGKAPAKVEERTTRHRNGGPGGALTVHQLSFEPRGNERLTHHLFRFPAKFHPPVVHQLIKDYTTAGDLILDPFCGSGTLMVEASVLGRNSIGVDVDPLSAFVSRVKTHGIERRRLDAAVATLEPQLEKLKRSTEQLGRFGAGEDLNDAEYAEAAGRLWVPAIPKLSHWFYRYATVDLAQLLVVIDGLDVDDRVRDFLRLVFAATIRSASRADPVPVSGLEVTKIMLKKEEAGRSVDVVTLFRRRLKRAVEDMESYTEARDKRATVKVHRGDIARLHANVAKEVSAVITSPPYHGAVDYYRRHQLEMFWLKMTSDQKERLQLLEKYLGRPKVPMRHPYLKGSGLARGESKLVEEKMRAVSAERADAFKHYAIGMSRALASVAKRTKEGSKVLFIVGHSTWNGDSIDTSKLMAELAAPNLKMIDRLWYPVKNRYMSYSRHNGANIDREYVLVFERCSNG